MILRRHPKLFRAGLDGKTYDRVLEHFCGTLRDLKVPEETIADALSIVQPYREIFEEGAALAAEEKRAEQRTRNVWQGVAVAVILVYAGSVMLARRRK